MTEKIKNFRIFENMPQKSPEYSNRARFLVFHRALAVLVSLIVKLRPTTLVKTLGTCTLTQ